MPQEEPEVSEELDVLQSVAREISEHTTRISNLGKKGLLSEVMVSEFSETLFPLLDDFVSSQIKHSAFVEDWLASLEEEILSGAKRPPIGLEDVEVLRFLLERLRDFVAGAVNIPDAPPEMLRGMREIESKLVVGNKILERLTENVEEAETGAEGSEGDSDDDEYPDDE